MRELYLTKRGLGYHLERLVEEGVIDVKPHGIFKFYYPAGYEETTRKLTPMQQEIVDIIRKDLCSTHEIADILEKTTKAIDYHLSNLLKMEVIERRGVGNGVFHWHVVEEK